jgi:hypothetical protein
MLLALAGSMLVIVPGAAAGGPFTDVGSLEPPPPPGAACQSVGPTTVVCHTSLAFFPTNQPLFDISCGTIYETAADVRTGIRWYENGRIARRHVSGHYDGTWRISPTGEGATIRTTGNWNSYSVWSTPGDDDTLVETFQGLHIKASGPGVGSDLMLAGRIDPDGTVHGILTVDEPLGQISPAAIVVLSGIFCG